MKLWIVGAGGLVGKALSRRCAELHLNYVATSKEEADITDLPQLLNVAHIIQPTHIINCAAYTNVDQAESEQELVRKINVEGPDNLARVAKEHRAKLIHLSSDYVFDGKGQAPYKEDDLCAPNGIYAKSKRDGELRIISSGADYCIIRTSWVFGRGGKNFISSILEAMKTKSVLKVVNDQSGCPTFCVDLANAILKLLPHSGIFHFANHGIVSRFDIAQVLLQEAKRMGYQLVCEKIEPVSSANFPTPAPRPSYSALSCEKLTATLGWKPRPWKETLKDYIHDLKN